MSEILMDIRDELKAENAHQLHPQPAPNQDQQETAQAKATLTDSTVDMETQ